KNAARWNHRYCRQGQPSGRIRRQRATAPRLHRSSPPRAALCHADRAPPQSVPMGKSRSPRPLRLIMWPPDLRLDEIGNEVRAALLPGGPGTLSGEGVRHGILALPDEGDERLVDCRIE